MFVILLSHSNLAMVMRDLEAGENLSTVVLISSIIYGGVVDFESDNLQHPYTRRLEVITSNLLVYNLQFPFKHDGHHGRDGQHGRDGYHGQAGHLDGNGHNGLDCQYR